MRVFVDTKPFRASHMKEPRGRGGWLFAFGDEDDQTTWRNFNGTFTEARKQAVEAARESSVNWVKVLP